MKFVLEIEMGNDGVADYFDLGCKLAAIGADMKAVYAADRWPQANDGRTVNDANGEDVGKWSILDPRHMITPNDSRCPPFEVNDAQYKALARKFQQNADGALDFNEFQSRARWGFDGVIMLPWCGMFLGIETDGYTHS